MRCTINKNRDTKENYTWNILDNTQLMNQWKKYADC